MKGTSPPEPSGGDHARVLYDELTDDLLDDPSIQRATMMGNPSLKLTGRLLGSYDAMEGCLVVKLPSARVEELIATGNGEPFAPGGRSFREWLSIPTPDRVLWQSLLDEAVDFARQGAAHKS